MDNFAKSGIFQSLQNGKNFEMLLVFVTVSAPGSGAGSGPFPGAAGLLVDTAGEELGGGGLSPWKILHLH